MAWILPILQNHDEDQMHVPASPPKASKHEAFDGELVEKPEPYVPADDAKNPEQQQS